MIRARHGLLERQSLENTALMGNGEDLSGSCKYDIRYEAWCSSLHIVRMPVFTRPDQANRSRSSTCTSSSGAETPPLSILDGYSSLSEGSLSSIDLSRLNVLPPNSTHPLSNAAVNDRALPHACGHVGVYPKLARHGLPFMKRLRRNCPRRRCPQAVLNPPSQVPILIPSGSLKPQRKQCVLLQCML